MARRLETNRNPAIAGESKLPFGDFCGPDDEYQAMVYNFSDKAVIIEKGERIGQGIIVNVDRAEFEEADHVDHPSRGGFGSTGQF